MNSKELGIKRMAYSWLAAGMVSLLSMPCIAGQYDIVDLGPSFFGPVDMNANGDVLDRVSGGSVVKQNDGTVVQLQRPLDYVPVSGLDIAGFAINDNRLVAGNYGGNYSSFIWENGVPTQLDAMESFVRDINNGGQAVGTVNTKTPVYDKKKTKVIGYSRTYYGALWQNGMRIDLTPGEPSIAMSINNLGQTVLSKGSAFSGDLCIWNNGSLTSLGIRVSLPSEQGSAKINDLGSVTGTGSGAFGSGAFFWKNGITQKITAPVGSGCQPVALNNHDQVVGTFTTILGRYAQTQSFIWANGVSVNLNDLLSAESRADWFVTRAVAINDSGVICAHAAYKVVPTTPGYPVSGNRTILLVPTN